MSVFHTEQSTLNKMFPDVKRSIEIAGDTKQFLVLVIIFWGGEMSLEFLLLSGTASQFFYHGGKARFYTSGLVPLLSN